MRFFLLVLGLCAAAWLYWFSNAEPVPPCFLPEVIQAPRAACLQMTGAQMVDLALRIQAGGVVVETPCLEVLP
jgi:hypothetical protein